MSSAEVFAGLDRERVIALEERHGNGDLIRLLEILGIGGPFKVLNPWELEDETGRHLVNAGGYAALPFGEGYPPLLRFVERFLSESRSMGFPQQSASDWRAALETNLVSLLAAVAPSHEDSQVFFSNSGAEAVEAALKFAKAARPRAEYIITFSRGYHGKTFGALSVTPNEEFQSSFALLPGIVTLPYGDSQALRDKLRALGPARVAAIILEPLQGEAGVIVPPADFLPALEAIRQAHGIVVIADEIQTGLGRSGHWFASVASGLDPDIITLAKPLGGGVVPIGATIARKWVGKRLLGGVYFKRHSNTFGGGSLAMAVGLKSLELIVEEDLVERARALGERGRAVLKALQASYPDYIQDARVAGMLLALQLRPLLPTHPAFEQALIRAYNLAMQPVLASRALPVPSTIISQLVGGLAVRSLHQAGIHACYSQNASRTVRLTPALNMPEATFEEMLRRAERAVAAFGHTSKLLSRSPTKAVSELVRMALLG